MPIPDYVMKISLFGDPSSCKELIRNYSSGVFYADANLTLGVDFCTKTIYHKDKTILLSLWDMTEMEGRFSKLIKYYISGSSGAIIMYDITNSEAVERLPFWLQTIRENNRNIPIFLIVNKIDLVDSHEVIKEEGVEIAKKYQLSHFIEVSSKTGQSIEDLFESLVELLIQLSSQNWAKEVEERKKKKKYKKKI